MTPQSEIDNIHTMMARRQKLTLINIAGIVLILLSQLALVKCLPKEYLEYMIFYPLLILAWGGVLVTLIIKVNIKIAQACSELSARIKERQHVRESECQTIRPPGE